MKNKRVFKPTLWATVVMFVSLVILLALGSWQLKRLSWKQDILKQVDARLKLERVDYSNISLPESAEELEALNYTPVRITGEFLYDAEIQLVPRTYNHKVGYHLYTPLKMPNGQIVLINRGWANDDVDIQRPKGTVEIQGKLHTAFEVNYFTPENVIDKNTWYWIDLTAVQNKFNLENLTPLIIFSDHNEKNIYPAGEQLIVKIPNNHFQYACFWFSMAGIMLVIYFLYHWQREEKDEKA